MESSPLTTVPAVRPVAPYLGGKRNLSRRLVALIAAVPHVTYAEPFVGMGGVFFRRTSRPRAEVINDLSADVANLFRVLQRHYNPLIDMLRWQLTSRAEFDRLLKVEADTLTDLERAARFLYLQRVAYGGKLTHRAFGVSRGLPGRFDVAKLRPMLEEAHERLSGVIVERLPFDQMITRYDTKETLFYIDPPYLGREDDYGRGLFSRADYERLRGLLEGLKGRFILTLNDTPEIRTLFAGFAIEPVALTYRISGAPTEGRELIITSRPKLEVCP